MLHMFATLATLVLLAGTTALIAALLDERREAILDALGFVPVRAPRPASVRRMRVRWQTAAGRPIAHGPAIAFGQARRAA